MSKKVDVDGVKAEVKATIAKGGLRVASIQALERMFAQADDAEAYGQATLDALKAKQTRVEGKRALTSASA